MHKSIFSRAGKAAGRSPPPPPRATNAMESAAAGGPSGANQPMVQVQLAEEGEGEGEEEEEGFTGEDGYQWSNDSYMVVETGGGSSYTSSVNGGDAMARAARGAVEAANASNAAESSTHASEGLGLLSTVNGLMRGAGLSPSNSSVPRSFSGGLSGGPIAEGTATDTESPSFPWARPQGPRGSLTSHTPDENSPLAASRGGRAGPVAEGFMRPGRGQPPVLVTGGDGIGSSSSGPQRETVSPRSEGASSFISR